MHRQTRSNRMPVFFASMLESIEQELILKEIEAKDLTNPYKLRHIIKIMNILDDIQYSELFIKHFTIWTQEDANSNIWSSLKGDIQSIFDLLPIAHQEYLMRELCSIEKNFSSRVLIVK
ncbi:hypothetical protein CSV60_15005 [Sporosarcina sp. P7]|nr:hypothetical protein CSV60_15005 [Sporosarcina sp. P7]